MRYILLAVFSLISFTPASYAQGIKVSFSPSSRFFPGFGNVSIGKSKDQTIIIKNADTSTGALNCSITGPTGNGFSFSGPASFSIGVGQSDTLILHFAPQVAGLVRDTIYISHNADTSFSLKNPVRYALSGTGVAADTFPKITVNTGFGGFFNVGTTPVGRTISASFTIRNTSDTIRTLTGNVGQTFTSRFSVTTGAGAFSLDTGNVQTVTVSFTPDTAAQFLVDSIIITSNAASPNNRIKITIIGSGTKASPFPQISIGGLQGGIINFRNDTIPKTKTAVFTIRNTSDSLRTLTGSVSTPGSPFAITSGSGAFSLDSGQTKTVTVTFAPTTAGLFRDTIIITTNSDAANQLIKIPLSGTGVIVAGPRISVQPLSINFGNLTQGGSAPSFAATIKNIADSATDTLRGSITQPGMPFSITSGSGDFTLAQNDSVRLIIQMATDNAGTFKDSIVILSNSNDNAKRFVLRLSGTVLGLGVKDGATRFLMTAAPNPFNNRTAIGFTLDEASTVSLKIVDVLGKEVFSASPQQHPAGPCEIEWNASGVQSGSYTCLLTIGKETHSLRIILEK
ncbi:MAG: choice-of-anchor D domain-containing protein [Bacteroidota bacterium]|nr:choice-of-anchor D domain-containing protein [Bacteroidota bacterium]MDP4229303.1 choice-of-anchor D domain-containing protein [Bacteroidota bacterium]MDP4234872.1 choice-of-anchor D domain-containing protein [Bacteroidota bacterium]